MTARVDALNTVFILLAFLLALFVPFHLFLFAYAVLGPLHYLTEIPWLHSNNYFTKKRTDGIVFIGVGICLVPLYFEVVEGSLALSAALIGTCFLWSLVGLFTERNDVRLLSFLGFLIICGVLTVLPVVPILFGILLPTLVHVFLFTLLFMLYGARKSHSTLGYVNILLVSLSVFAFFVLQKESSFGISKYITESYSQTFAILHFTLGDLIGRPFEDGRTIFTSALGVVFMQCIAFAYTYHYLNWFSKTGVIKWHEHVWLYRYYILAIWVASISLYAYSYVLGLTALYFLSMVHVLMEFPLNMRTIQALIQRK